MMIAHILSNDDAHASAINLCAWADGATDRLLRGVYLQRSTSLFVRARGEIEHEVVGELVREVRTFIDLIESAGGA